MIEQKNCVPRNMWNVFAIDRQNWIKFKWHSQSIATEKFDNKSNIRKATKRKKTKKNKIFNDNTLIVTVSKTDFTVLGVRYVSNTSNQHSITFNESENQAYHKKNWRRIVNEFLGAICVYSYVLSTRMS